MTGAEPARTPAAGREAVERVGQSIRSGDMAGARRLAIEALAAGVEHPLLLNLRALQHEDDGRFEASLADLQRAHLLAPNDFAILNACGLALGRLERIEEAVSCFDQASALEPRFTPAWFNRGWALERLGETAKAAQSYAKAAELKPDHVQAWASLAWLAARRGDAEAARLSADRALALQPGQPTAILALASVEVAQAPRIAEERLRALLASQDLGPFDRALAFGQLGDALDALDQPSEAFAAYSQSNAIFRDEARARFEAPGQETAAGSLTWMTRWAEDLDERRWRSSDADRTAEAGERGHVFLIGFPRSGTTLIESVLAAHPDVVSLEERNTLDAAVRAFVGDTRSLSMLGQANGRDLAPHRADYWRRVKSYGVDPAGKIFIDKNPFNTPKLPVIYKLFPNAKIIFAVRDPRDVVLSCFRRRFSLNASTYELLDLGRAAAFYDATMRFAEIMRSRQNLPEHVLVYERLTQDFEAEAKAVCAFIGADWRPELADFAGRARRGDVASASSAQIARGLYADGAGQWRRYAAELAPILGVLAPWVERFGYPSQ